MALNKSSAEYYNLEKVAEVLSVSTAEVNRLREQSKLRGFRDGANWKFLIEDVHTYLAEAIKARGGGANEQKAEDSGFDLAADIASASSFDLLVEETALPDDDQLISVSQPKSDVDLAALEQDSELALAEETQISSLVVPKKPKTQEIPKQELDSSSVIPGTLESSSVVSGKAESGAVSSELESSALILAAEKELGEDSIFGLVSGGSSPQLGRASESGFDVLVAGESEEEDLLQVDTESTESVESMVVEFTLEPSSQVLGDDDSESSSQIIEIDMGGLAEAAVTQEADPFGQDSFGDFPGFDGGLAAEPAAGTNEPFGAGASPFPSGDAFTAPIATATPKKPTAQQEEYSTGVLVALGFALAMLLFPGILLIDTMLHMWSWNDPPFGLNGLLASTIADLFGL